ncbi:SDR family oxidoreductase [bacterium]|nr:SDR family oxidoreductase [bacterium]
MPTTFDLTDKVAIVTGGGRGIGRSIALALADSGAKVAVTARSKDQLDSVVQEIRAKGREALAIEADLMETGRIPVIVEETVNAFQKVDILINNAARSFMRPLMDLREDGYDKIFDVNVKAAFLLSRLAAKEMMKAGGGRIVNITTVGAVRGGAGMGIYHASKAALTMLTKCMAVEWAGLNINVNAVGPGLTRTPFSQPIWSNPEIEAAITARIPKGRLAEPEEVVGAVLFLCTENAQYITGETIYVDGGSLANT